jgi:hypothetical protein
MDFAVTPVPDLIREWSGSDLARSAGEKPDKKMPVISVSAIGQPLAEKPTDMLLG